MDSIGSCVSDCNQPNDGTNKHPDDGDHVKLEGVHGDGKMLQIGRDYDTDEKKDSYDCNKRENDENMGVNDCPLTKTVGTVSVDYFKTGDEVHIKEGPIEKSTPEDDSLPCNKEAADEDNVTPGDGTEPKALGYPQTDQMEVEQDIRSKAKHMKDESDKHQVEYGVKQDVTSDAEHEKNSSLPLKDTVNKSDRSTEPVKMKENITQSSHDYITNQDEVQGKNDVEMRHLNCENTDVSLEMKKQSVLTRNVDLMTEVIPTPSSSSDATGQQEGKDENDTKRVPIERDVSVSECTDNRNTKEDGADSNLEKKIDEENSEPSTYRQTINIHDSDSSSLSSDDSTSDLGSGEGDDEDEDEVVMPDHVGKKDQEDIRTKGELGPEDLPPIEDLHITVAEDIPMWELGEVSSIVGILVIVQAKQDTPALDEYTILFKEDRTPLGQVFETFGPVMSPYYSIRFNSTTDIEEKKITSGLKVFYVPTVEEWTHFVFLAQLQKLKGSDASWENNNEPPDKFKDFSDDEEERRFKAKSRMKKTGQGGEEGADDGIKNKRKSRHHKQMGRHVSDNIPTTNEQPNRFNQWPPPGPPPFGPGLDERFGLPPMGNGSIRPPPGSSPGPGGFPRAVPPWLGPRPFNNPWSEQGYHNRPRGQPPRPGFNRNQQHGCFPPVQQGPPIMGPNGNDSTGPPPGPPGSNHQLTAGPSEANGNKFMMMDMRFVQNKAGQSGTTTPTNSANGPPPGAENVTGSSAPPPGLGQGPPGQFRPPFRGPCPPQHVGPPPPIGPGPQGSHRPPGPIQPHGIGPVCMGPNPPWNVPHGPPPSGFQGPPFPRYPQVPPPPGARPPNFNRFQTPQFGGRPNFPQGPEHNWNFNT